MTKEASDGDPGSPMLQAELMGKYGGGNVVKFGEGIQSTNSFAPPQIHQHTIISDIQILDHTNRDENEEE